MRAAEPFGVELRIAAARASTKGIRRVLTWLVRRSSESRRAYLEAAGIDVTGLLRG